MPDFIFNRTVKKRRGVYSESDIHAPWRQYTENGRLYSEYYSLSNAKNIRVPNTTSVVKKSHRVCYSILNEVTELTDVATQTTSIQLIRDPVITIDDLGIISEGCIIKYSINDEEPNERFTITEKLNDIVISEKENVNNGNFTIDYNINLSDEQISSLVFNSTNNITIEISTEKGGLVTSKTVTFTKGNTKPKLNITSYNSTSATFIAIDTDNNLSKIEWFIDDVLKETITTDLTTEKTINYELTDNAIHTLKIVATDAENATSEKVLSISKEIMPLQSDATLQDISTKLVEIGEGFKNGKTSIINTLALKNIDASLNNTLVELSEKIKTSFDSSDASVEDLTNKLTQANNTISQLNTKYKFAYSLDLTVHWFIDCGFKPDFVIYECINKHGKFLVFLTPFNYSVFDIGNLGWTITAREDISKKDSFSMNNINQFWGTKIRDTGFNNADMPKDSLNDRYVFWIAIKCL